MDTPVISTGYFGRTTTVPCFGFPGNVFNSLGCSNNVPQACISAAASEPTNPSVPATDPLATGTSALQQFGCYQAGSSVIVPPAQGTYGNMYRNEITGAPFFEWNASVTKELKKGDRFTAQFRAEAFNLTNSATTGRPAASRSWRRALACRPRPSMPATRLTAQATRAASSWV